jgi:DNA-binding MarR family transcriptional regulator
VIPARAAAARRASQASGRRPAFAKCRLCERGWSKVAEPTKARTIVDADRFEVAYRRIWRVLHRPAVPGLGGHALQVLRQVPADGAISLTGLAANLGLPKSTTSVLVKALAGKGLLSRARDASDERRLRIALTAEGKEALGADTILAPDRLADALAALPAATRAALLAGLEELATVSERLPGGPGGAGAGAR